MATVSLLRFAYVTPRWLFYGGGMSHASTTSRSPAQRLAGPMRRSVVRIKSTRTGLIAWRIVIAVLGMAVIAIGVLLLALPGPGWLIIFAGLGILATEFEWAKRLLRFARNQVGRWTNWMRRQPRPIQALVGLAGVVLLAALALGLWYVSR